MRAEGKAPKAGTGNGNGRNKSRAKKREYKAHCYTMRTSGYCTDANGQWSANPKTIPGLSDASIRGSTAK